MTEVRTWRLTEVRTWRLTEVRTWRLIILTETDFSFRLSRCNRVGSWIQVQLTHVRHVVGLSNTRSRWPGWVRTIYQLGKLRINILNGSVLKIKLVFFSGFSQVVRYILFIFGFRFNWSKNLDPFTGWLAIIRLSSSLVDSSLFMVWALL